MFNCIHTIENDHKEEKLKLTMRINSILSFPERAGVKKDINA